MRRRLACRSRWARRLDCARRRSKSTTSVTGASAGHGARRPPAPSLRPPEALQGSPTRRRRHQWRRSSRTCGCQPLRRNQRLRGTAQSLRQEPKRLGRPLRRKSRRPARSLRRKPRRRRLSCRSQSQRSRLRRRSRCRRHPRRRSQRTPRSCGRSMARWASCARSRGSSAGSSSGLSVRWVCAARGDRRARAQQWRRRRDAPTSHLRRLCRSRSPGWKRRPCSGRSSRRTGGRRAVSRRRRSGRRARRPLGRTSRQSRPPSSSSRSPRSPRRPRRRRPSAFARSARSA
mmetsp:Transcript_17627/g.50741  ORF Transcript_17627/g.50741 Transcript_17627/m.50741 type:complete len:288 (-) Transcript_17627:1407-2270(-)